MALNISFKLTNIFGYLQISRMDSPEFRTLSMAEKGICYLFNNQKACVEKQTFDSGKQETSGTTTTIMLVFFLLHYI